MLAVWMSLVVILNGIIWTTGVPDYDLAEAVEKGAARVEQRSVGEDSEDVVRKSIQLQRDSLSFWTVIRAVGDFLGGPVMDCFTGIGRGRGAECGGGGQWPAGAVSGGDEAMRGLAGCVGSGTDSPSCAHAGPPSVGYRDLRRAPVAAARLAAREWVLLHQIDCFAMIGWLGMAWSACRRGQTNLYVALLTCFVVAAIEAPIRGSFWLLVNLGMRLTIFPE